MEANVLSSSGPPRAALTGARRCDCSVMRGKRVQLGSSNDQLTGRIERVRLGWQSRWAGQELKVVGFATRHEEQKVEDSPTEKKGGGGGGSLLSFLCPLLKLVGGGDPAAPRNAIFESATSGVASFARLPWGSQVDPEIAAARTAGGQPPKLFQLYEFEACPFCRRVREALTELDLSAEVYPCPKGSLRHREFVRKNGGKEQYCSCPCF